MSSHNKVVFINSDTTLSVQRSGGKSEFSSSELWSDVASSVIRTGSEVDLLSFSWCRELDGLEGP